MKCPHCEYEYKGRWDFDKDCMVEENSGDFFYGDRLERSDGAKVQIIGCPNCFKTFIY